MADSIKRVNRKIGAVDSGQAASAEHSPYTGAKKTQNMGHQLTNLGELSSAVAVRPGKTIACFNSNATTLRFVRTSSDGSAPTDVSDGIPVAPHEWLYISVPLGDNAIRSDNSDVAGWLVTDDTELIKQDI